MLAHFLLKNTRKFSQSSENSITSSFKRGQHEREREQIKSHSWKLMWFKINKHVCVTAYFIIKMQAAGGDTLLIRLRR